jgi:murein DD-endopeptidase MepM/ murein hydrolase activator NlpD
MKTLLVLLLTTLLGCSKDLNSNESFEFTTTTKGNDVNVTTKNNDKYYNPIIPTKGVVSRGYTYNKHEGVDIAGKTGTPIYATEDGVVINSFPKTLEDWGLGHSIKIQYNKKADPTKLKLTNNKQIKSNYTLTGNYGHNSKIAINPQTNKSFTKGDVVKKGQIIAYMGSTGQSTGPHLHYELAIDYETNFKLPGQNSVKKTSYMLIDPQQFLPKLNFR